MKIVTINVPIEYLEAIEKLTGKDGMYPSRSELVRCAVRDFLIKELTIAKNIRRYNDTNESEEEKDLDESKYVRIPVLKNRTNQFSEALESIIVFNNPFFDKILQCLIKNKIFISPADLAQQIDISTKTATQQLECLNTKFSQFVKKNRNKYKVDIYFLIEYLRAHNQKKILQNLEKCLSLLKQNDNGVNSQPEFELKTYKIIQRLE